MFEIGRLDIIETSICIRLDVVQLFDRYDVQIYSFGCYKTIQIYNFEHSKYVWKCSVGHLLNM